MGRGSFKHHRFPSDVILLAVRWYCRFVKNPSLDPDIDLVAPAADGHFQTTYSVPLRQPFMSEDDFIEVAKSWRRDEILSLVAA